MANDPDDPFKKQINGEANMFKADLLSDRQPHRWPETIDFVASELTGDDQYMIGPQKFNQHLLDTGRELDAAASDHYFEGLEALIEGSHSRYPAADEIDLGNFLVQFAELRQGIRDVNEDLQPGEVLGRLLTRNLRRNKNTETARAAQSLPAELDTPRECIAEAMTTPEIAETMNTTLPDNSEGETLVNQLGEVQLATPLWGHQREALADWLSQGVHGYVSMATATGKTVLGLAAMAYMLDSGSLHPRDKDQLKEDISGALPEPDHARPDNILIVTTDELLRVQWARLFEEHCQTPSEFTRIENSSIEFPWGTVDIRSADGLGGTDPSDYRMAIFDEVHNYTTTSDAGWGTYLAEFIEADCPVLALTASVTDDLRGISSSTETDFEQVGESYTLEQAKADGIIPDFSWQLVLTGVRDTDKLPRLRETAEIARDLIEYEPDKLRITEENLLNVAPSLDLTEQNRLVGRYNSHTELANELKIGSEDLSSPTKVLDTAADLGNRSLNRLHLKTQTSVAFDIASEALANGQPPLILTRTYTQANRLADQLTAESDEWEITIIEQEQSADNQDEAIVSFDETSTDQKALIGSAERIGQGIDIQTAEVGINIARPMTGANPRLVQRLGRLLRDAGDVTSVQFHHIVGVQPRETVLPVDGESFIRNMAGFFGDVAEPEDDDALSAPDVDFTTNAVVESVVRLEQSGVGQFGDSNQLTKLETAYVSAISEMLNGEEGQSPVLNTDWVPAMEAIHDSDTESSHTESDESSAPDGSSNGGGEPGAEHPESSQAMSGDTTETETGQPSAISDAPQTESVSIDPLLIGLVRLAANSENEDEDSPLDIVEHALDDLLVEALTVRIAGPQFTTGDDRRLDIVTDDVLDEYLARLTDLHDEATSPADILLRALRSQHDLDDTKTVPVIENNHEQLFTALIGSSATDCEDRADVVEIALLQRFEIV